MNGETKRMRELDNYIQFLDDFSERENNAITRYYTYVSKKLKSGHIKQNTFEQYVYRLGRIYQFIRETGLNIEQWEIDTVHDFVGWIKSTHRIGREAERMSAYFTMLRLVIQYNLKRELFNDEIRRKMREIMEELKIVIGKADEYLPLSEIKRLLQTSEIKDETRNLITFYLYTGARRGELFESGTKLLGNDRLRIETSKVKLIERDRIRPRELYVHSFVRDSVERVLEWREKYKAEDINVLFREIDVHTIGGEEYRELFPYLLRHTAITYQVEVAIDRKIPLDIIRQLFGWKVFKESEDMISRYFHKKHKLTEECYEFTKKYHWFKEKGVI